MDIQFTSTTPKEEKQEFVSSLSKFGGMTFLENIPVLKGAPTPPPLISAFYKTITHAQRFEWQYRVAMAFKELPGHQCAWVTLTYAVEPPTWEAARKNMKMWLRRVQDYKTRVLLPALEGAGESLDDSKIHYIIVEEEGAENGRKHFHALVWLPAPLPIKQWEDKLIKWQHGFQKVKRVKPDDTVGLAIYVAKYATKAQGRIKCSYNFGLTTAIILLSTSSFRKLALVNIQIAQKLLRRVSLTPNYLTSRKMTYLISRLSSSTTSHKLQPRKNQRVTGLLTSGCQAVSDPDGRARSAVLEAAACSKTVSYSLVKDAVGEIRYLVASKVLSPLQVPGVAGFGRPRVLTVSSQLEPGKNTLIWFTKSAYPRSRRNRARGPIPVGEPR